MWIYLDSYQHLLTGLYNLASLTAKLFTHCYFNLPFKIITEIRGNFSWLLAKWISSSLKRQFVFFLFFSIGFYYSFLGAHRLRISTLILQCLPRYPVLKKCIQNLEMKREYVAYLFIVIPEHGFSKPTKGLLNFLE